ncbi:hypothetical protein ACHAXA_008976 [Cyclostephanos tholiformis]|uniref:R3H domain-containing protein n=1 Tax=Cyclostephanos tholiformis TaxID=382380 RepID=A0ABD3RDX1_9STRA
MATMVDRPTPQDNPIRPFDEFSPADNAPSSGRGGRQQQRRRGGRGQGRGGGIGRVIGDGERRRQQQQEQKRQEQPRSTNGNGSETTNVDGETATKRGRGRARRRGRCVGRGADADSDAADFIASAIAEGSMDVSTAPENGHAGVSESVENSNGTAQGDNTAQISAKETQKKRNKKKVGKPRDEATNQGTMQQKQPSNPDRKKKMKNKGRKQWRDCIPAGLDDPISLEPLDQLPYPPFAIVVEPPYVPIWPGMWPPPRPDSRHATSTTDSSSSSAERVTSIAKSRGAGSKDDEKEREMAILREQWGDVSTVLSKTKDNQSNDINPKRSPVDESTATINNVNNENNIQGRQVNLFDGRVLAYYLVSTLQFIDPYNRRDLTRGELQALDAYLALHKLGNACVVEAYDDKGVTLSTAGRAAQSATGRAEILQQEARAILGSFFAQGGSGSGGGASSSQMQGQSSERQRDIRRVHSLNNTMEVVEPAANSFQRMYAAQQGVSIRNNMPSSAAALNDIGIYEGYGGGLLLIDDDINPGLRSGIPLYNNEMRGSYSARQIAERHSHEAQILEGAFPTLHSAAVSEAADSGKAVSEKGPPTQPSGPSRSLSKISKVVTKTDKKQIEKMIKAREEAERRAELSKLSYFNPNFPSGTATVSVFNNSTLPTTLMTRTPPSDAVLARNRNLALALDVAPSTVRNEPTLTGWARPVTQDAASVLTDMGDEFQKELAVNPKAQYTDSMLSEARDRMSELLKLESKWKKFLVDDRAMSCSLKAMNRPMRKFVHEYSDFWRLHTESFDPEGRRYIHCVKLEDTRAPNPLLSEAARKWRGPTRPITGPSAADVDLTMLPTGPASKLSAAVAVPAAIDGWRSEQRVPLKLAPRTVAGGVAKPITEFTMGGMTRSSSTPLLSMTGERPPPPRFAALHDKERPRLKLAPRSIPTWDELEKRHVSQNEWNEMTPDQQEVILLEIEEDDRKKTAQMQREREKEDARALRLDNKNKKKRAMMKKKQAILESAFASGDDDDGSSGSDWFEGDLEFDGSDDEGKLG